MPKKNLRGESKVFMVLWFYFYSMQYTKHLIGHFLYDKLNKIFKTH